MTTRPSGERGARRSRSSWRVRRYLAFETLKVSAFIFVLLELLYALFFAVIVARRHELDLLLVLPVFWRTALSMLNDSVPLALLFGSGLVYGRLVADREIMALKGFGYSYAQLLSSVLFLGVIFTVTGFFINGYLVPEMNYARRNIKGILLAQLRYLGEGWNRDFRFGDKSLWIMHHNGRRLRGIFLSAQGDEGEGLLPQVISQRIRPITYPVYLFAEEGRILFREDLEGTEEQPGNGEDTGEDRPGEGRSAEDVMIELYNVSVFFADGLITKTKSPNTLGRHSDEHDPASDDGHRTARPKADELPGDGARPHSYFMQSAHIDRLPVQYNPARERSRGRRAKHLMLPTLLSSVAGIRELLRTDSLDENAQTQQEAELNKLLTELHGRGASTLTMLAYPLIAALIALFLNSPNRLVPFFASGLLAPTAFYGLFSVGQVLGRAGVAPWLSMYAGVSVLFLLAATLYVLLERRVMR